MPGTMLGDHRRQAPQVLDAPRQMLRSSLAEGDEGPADESAAIAGHQQVELVVVQAHLRGVALHDAVVPAAPDMLELGDAMVDARQVEVPQTAELSIAEGHVPRGEVTVDDLHRERAPFQTLERPPGSVDRVTQD